MIVKDINQISSSALAFVGDGVYSLYIRANLATSCDSKSGGLHKVASKIVSAIAQSAFIDKILDRLNIEELAIFKRCKNAHTQNKPSTCTYEQYKKATGFEGLLGWLYLSGNMDRIQEILSWH